MDCTQRRASPSRRWSVNPAELLDQQPPCDSEAERWCLASPLIRSSALEDLGRLRPEDFYLGAHQVIFRRLLAMREKHLPIEAGVLVRELKSAGELEAVGGIAYISELAGGFPTSFHAAYYAEIVREKARLRGLIHAAVEVLRDAYTAGDPAENVLDRATAALAAIQVGQYSGEPVTLADATAQALDRIDAIHRRQGAAGLLTGLLQFDEDYGGLFPGELVILASRPGVGKTSLALQLAAHAAERGHLVLFASLEMRAAELASRLLCARAGVSSRTVRTGRLTDGDVASLVEAANQQSAASLQILDRPAVTVAEVARAARRLRGKGLALLVVDYLQRITPADRKANRYEQIGQITRALKELAGELQVPVLVPCQLGRPAESEAPKLSHLRESGDIEADADVVLLLERQPAGYEDKGVKADAILHVAKNRNAETGRLPLCWDGPRTRFSCLDP